MRRYIPASEVLVDGIDGIMEVMEMIDGSSPLFVSETRASYGAAPKSHRDLRICQRAFDLAMQIHRLSAEFPFEERFSLADQIRRSSKSVCSAIAEGWRRRRYKAAFINKINESESEAAETQVWLEFAAACGYISQPEADKLIEDYESLLYSLIAVIEHSDKWIIKTK